VGFAVCAPRARGTCGLRRWRASPAKRGRRAGRGSSGFELGILGEKPQALEGTETIRIIISIRHPQRQLQPKRRDQFRC
jgi:hypothetical protein